MFVFVFEFVFVLQLSEKTFVFVFLFLWHILHNISIPPFPLCSSLFCSLACKLESLLLHRHAICHQQQKQHKSKIFCFLSENMFFCGNDDDGDGGDGDGAGGLVWW